MEPIALHRYFPTFVDGYCGLLRLIKAIWRIGVWLSPRVAMALVLVMCCELAWIMGNPDAIARSMVPAVLGMRTLVGFLHSTPPPWPRGNCFSIPPKARWLGPMSGTQTIGGHVSNMNAENFEAIVQQRKLQRVEIRAIDDRNCLITDSRIPSDRLLDKHCPHCVRGPYSEVLLMRFPENFRRPSGR